MQPLLMGAAHAENIGRGLITTSGNTQKDKYPFLCTIHLIDTNYINEFEQNWDQIQIGTINNQQIQTIDKGHQKVEGRQRVGETVAVMVQLYRGRKV